MIELAERMIKNFTVAYDLNKTTVTRPRGSSAIT